MLWWTVIQLEECHLSKAGVLTWSSPSINPHHYHDSHHYHDLLHCTGLESKCRGMCGNTMYPTSITKQCRCSFCELPKSNQFLQPFRLKI